MIYMQLVGAEDLQSNSWENDMKKMKIWPLMLAIAFLLIGVGIMFLSQQPTPVVADNEGRNQEQTAALTEASNTWVKPDLSKNGVSGINRLDD